MTSRDRIAALLRKEIPDRMGIYEHFWKETLSAWAEQGYLDGADPEVHFALDITGRFGGIDNCPFPGREEVIKETDEWRITRDGRGATLKTWKDKSGVPEHIGFDVTTPETWREYRQPLLEVDRSRLNDLPETKQTLARARQQGKAARFGNPFVFELLRATIGDENFLPALLLEPDWIHDFCQVYLDMYRAHYDLLFREVGLPDCMWVYEDFGFTNGLFCSPRTMAELVFPYEKQLVGFFHDHGLPVILHSCGDIREAIPLIIDAGFDCLQPMEAKAGCDVVEIAKTYGRRIAYMGNIDVVALSTNDPVKIEAEILPKLKALKDMRAPYMFHSDHSISPAISYDTYTYAVDLFRENSRY